jgi:RNA polymerase sigma factor (sigma-70 family)
LQHAHRRRRGKAAEELILRTVAAHADSLLRTARRHSLCPDDAQDAYQRGLEIFMAHAERLDAAKAAGWLHVVVKHEAQAIRRSRQKLVASDDVDLDSHEARSLPTPDEQVAALDLVGRAAEALQRLKPQELRALWLKAEGHSYNEIAEITGWTYTKVNRCLSEGRRSFLSRYAIIESGAECERWLPVISAMVDGETTPDQLMELRPHLRNCASCRATLGVLRGSSKPLSMVLPIPLLAVGAGRGEHVTDLVTRGYETVANGFQERAVHAATKLQALFEAASTGKVAAVAASAAVAVGGGYATVERKVPVKQQHKPAKVGTKVIMTSPRAGEPDVQSATHTDSPSRSKPALGEFGKSPSRASARAPEFVPPRDLSTQYSRSAIGTATTPPPAAVITPHRASPEFGDPQRAPEFGG